MIATIHTLKEANIRKVTVPECGVHQSGRERANTYPNSLRICLTQSRLPRCSCRNTAKNSRITRCISKEDSCRSLWIDGEGEWNDRWLISTRRPVICSISRLVDRTIKSPSEQRCRCHGIDRQTAQIRVGHSVPAQVPAIAAVCTLVNAAGTTRAIDGGDIKRGGRQRINDQSDDETSS